MKSMELKRLHSLLLALNPQYKMKGDICSNKVRDYWLNFCKRNLNKTNDIDLSSKLHCIKSVIYTIELLRRSIVSLEIQLKACKTQEVDILMSISGVGLVTACNMISCIGNINRFKSADKLASYAGISPVRFASGKSSKELCNTRGNRKLNSHFYHIALTASRCDEISKQYYQKKLNEGKSKKQAIRDLSQRLVKIVFVLLNKKDFYSIEKYHQIKKPAKKIL
jgi:hypothetical protein